MFQSHSFGIGHACSFRWVVFRGNTGINIVIIGAVHAPCEYAPIESPPQQPAQSPVGQILGSANAEAAPLGPQGAVAVRA